jgi:hypothetical protein
MTPIPPPKIRPAKAPTTTRLSLNFRARYTNPHPQINEPIAPKGKTNQKTGLRKRVFDCLVARLPIIIEDNIKDTRTSPIKPARKNRKRKTGK